MAQAALGNMNLAGMGMPKDVGAAFGWYEKAATGGDANSANVLASAYTSGELVRKDLAVAAKWHLRAAELGDQKAQFNAAVIYLKSQGVGEDFVKSYFWASLAALGDDPDMAAAAVRLKGLLARALTKGQIASVEKRVAAVREASSAMAR